MIDKDVIEILVCPETHQPLRAADPALLERLNALISEGALRNHDGDIVVDPMEEALVREDGERLYPVREDIPIMLVGESVDLTDLPGDRAGT